MNNRLYWKLHQKKLRKVRAQKEEKEKKETTSFLLTFLNLNVDFRKKQ